MNWGKVAEVTIKLVMATGPILLSLLTKDDGIKVDKLLKK